MHGHKTKQNDAFQSQKKRRKKKNSKLTLTDDVVHVTFHLPLYTNSKNKLKL